MQIKELDLTSQHPNVPELLNMQGKQYKSPIVWLSINIAFQSSDHKEENIKCKPQPCIILFNEVTIYGTFHTNSISRKQELEIAKAALEYGLQSLIDSANPNILYISPFNLPLPNETHPITKMFNSLFFLDVNEYIYFFGGGVLKFY